MKPRMLRAIPSARVPRRAVARSLPPYTAEVSFERSFFHAVSSVCDGRPTAVAIIVAVLAFLVVLANRVYADPVEAVVRAKLQPAMPAGLDVARVYLPPNLATLDLDPARVAVELPRELRAGRASIKLTIRGRISGVQVAIAALSEVAIAQRDLAPGEVIADEDIAIERRAVADIAMAPTATLVGATVNAPIAAGAAIAARDVALPAPLPRGTQVAVDVRRGAIHIRGTGTLEMSARPGQLATARLAATRTVVHGRLAAPATLIVGEGP
jgi:flagella basal body P-ring formation protein FlgA